MRKIFKIAGISLGGIISLFLILYLLLSLGILNPVISKLTVRIVNKNIGAELSIDQIKGNIFRIITLKDVQVSEDEKLIVSIHEIAVDYVFKSLLSRKIEIDSFSISGINMHLEEYPDSSWNIQKLIPESDSTKRKKKSSPKSWILHLKEITINDFNTAIRAQDSLSNTPHAFAFNARLNVFIEEKASVFHLINFNGTVLDPSLNIKSLSFDASLKDSIFSWKSFNLELNNSNISSEGNIPLNNVLYSDVTLTALPLNMTDFHDWIPYYGSADCNLKLENKGQNSNVNLQLQQENQSINITGSISQLKDHPIYNLLLVADNLDGEYWTHNTDLKSNIKGEFQLNGEGLDIKTNTFNLSGTLADMKYVNYDLRDLSFNLDKIKNQISFILQANTNFANVKSKINITDLFEQQNYEALVNIKNLNLAKITSKNEFESSINLDINAEGRGYVFDDMDATISINSSQSSIFNQDFSSFNAFLSLKDNNYNLEGLHLESSNFKANLSGRGNLDQNNEVNFEIAVKDIEQTLVLLGINPFRLNGGVSGTLSGTKEALELNTDFAIAAFMIDSFTIANAEGKLSTKFSYNDIVKTGKASNLKEIYDTPSPLKKLKVNLNASVEYIALENINVKNVNLDLYKDFESIKGSVNSASNWGIQETEFILNHIFTDPDYSFTSLLKNIDLSELLTQNPTESDINLIINGSGESFYLDSLKADLEISSIASYYNGVSLDDFNAQFHYNKGKFSIDNFFFEAPFIDARIEGGGDWNSNIDLNFNLQTKDIKGFTISLGKHIISLNGGISGQLHGAHDSLKLTSLTRLNNLQIDSLLIGQLSIDSQVELNNRLVTGVIDLQMEDSHFKTFNIEEIQLNSVFNNEKAINSLSFHANDSTYGHIFNDVYFADNPSLFFNDIELFFNEARWTNTNDSSNIQFKKDKIELNNIRFASTDGAINADGYFSFAGQENLEVEIKNLNIGNGFGYQLFNNRYSGIIDASLNLKGSADLPQIAGKLEVNNLRIDTLNFSKFLTSIEYSGDSLKLFSQLDDHNTTLIRTDLRLPMHLSFTDTFFLPHLDNQVIADLYVDKLDLSKFKRYIEVDYLDYAGLISANIHLQNTLREPDFSGFFSINKGAISYKKLGAYYSDIGLSSHIEKSNLFIDSLLVYAGKGRMKFDGLIELDSVFTGVPFKSVDLNMKALNFKAFDSEMLKAVINSDVNLKGTADKSELSGKVTLTQSTLNTDIFLKEFNRVSDNSDLPLLVQAQKDKEIKEVNYAPDTVRKKTPEIYKNLSGQFDIVIPRNTWVKGKNMNFELAGNLKAIKRGDQIDLFGTMNVKRGFYKIYGRRLEFEEGEVTFTGGASLDPVINFKIAYKFRDIDNQLQKLIVNITGRYSKPEVSFSINDKIIEEKDAISYLLFNKSVNHLDSRENASLINSNLDIAANLAIGQFTNLISDALQSSLKLDVIEITGNSSTSEGSVSVGKYINSKLFLNYERTFALDKKDDVINPDKITLEYQFYRSLFLQATNQSSNSGFDFIFKKTWK